MSKLSNSVQATLRVAILAGAAVGCDQPPTLHVPATVVHPQVRAALSSSDEVDVIVNFRDPAPHALPHDRESHRDAIQKLRESILAGVPAGFASRRSFGHVPAIAGRASRAALEALAHDPNVESIQLDGAGSGALLQAVPAIHGDVAKKTYNVSGKGVRVAVLDSGVSSTHPDLKASLLSTQHCFTRNACPPSNTSEGTNAEDDNGHGSHVAGIVTADGIMNKVGPGFAPDAEIVAVKVDDKNDSGYISDWIAGLDWAFSNLSTLNVKVINMSICTTDRYATATDCDSQQPAMAKAVKSLVDAGVTIFAASGNTGDKAKLSSPACNTGVIAVGATYKMDQGKQPDNGQSYSQWVGFGDCTDATTAFDQVTCFTNSGPRLDMVAPGAVIVSAYMGSTQYGSYRGTSQASPAAAGVASLMLQCNPNLKPADVKDILVRTAVTVKDAKSGLSFPSIRADMAVKEACTAVTSDAGAGGISGSGGATGTGGVTTAAGGTPGSGGTSSAGSGGSTSNPGGGGYADTGGASGGTGGSGGHAAGGANPGASSNSSGAGGAVVAGVGGNALGGSTGRGGSGSSSSSGKAAGTSGNSGCSCSLGARPNSSSTAAMGFALVLGLVVRKLRWWPS